MPRIQPRCPECGGVMERIIHGGQTRDESGHWVPSKSEMWRCVAAFKAYKQAEQKAVLLVHEQFGAHLELVTVVQP